MAKLSRVLGVLQRYRHSPDGERSPEQMIRDLKATADEPSQDRLLDSLSLFDDSLRSLEQGRKPPSQSKQSIKG
jgi:hypothetical protein